MVVIDTFPPPSNEVEPLTSPVKLIVFAEEDPIVVEINEENFPDPVFRNMLLNGTYMDWSQMPPVEYYYDKNRDGFLSKGELESITYLIVADMGIFNLTGIEYFTSLVELDCQYNVITKLDLRKNTELIYLNCYHNMLIGTLDLSNNTKLIGISAHSNPFLTDIKTDKIDTLESLNFDNTPIKQLDTSKYPNLANLSVASTDIEVLDLSNNTKLLSINAYNTKLTNIDLSNNPLVGYLGFSQTEFTSFDIRNCPDAYFLDLKFAPVAWVEIGNNPGLQFDITDSTITLEVPNDSFDITEVLPGIDPSKISIESGAQLDGKVLSGYSFDTPIIYSYACGISNQGTSTLKVTANLTEKIPASNADVPEADNTTGGNALENDIPGSSNNTVPPATGDGGITIWIIMMLLSASIIIINMSYTKNR